MDSKNQRPIGAVIVDPASRTIKSVAHDESQGHPLKHAAMVAINRLAEEDVATNPTRVHYLCTDYHIYLTREPCVMYAPVLRMFPDAYTYELQVFHGHSAFSLRQSHLWERKRGYWGTWQQVQGPF